MEARDSSTSPSSTAANRDASSVTDADDAVFTVAVALAKDAALHFQSGKFAECVDVLNQLLQKKQDDPKFSRKHEFNGAVRIVHIKPPIQVYKLKCLILWYFIILQSRNSSVMDVQTPKSCLKYLMASRYANLKFISLSLS
ncbi:uncharacterized protein LOC107640690 isoform X1 [Arachis ipaensis]|uniref:uncharacterized protein LOC107640690 isoform X1 n=1 Tax=Arachis ipaensis TaxID=130454 RepID=UPI000A2AFE3F|nr:uncharacterized protein LOC107640690 isoform X1 [Arachis ipaensis]